MKTSKVIRYEDTFRTTKKGNNIFFVEFQDGNSGKTINKFNIGETVPYELKTYEINNQKYNWINKVRQSFNKRLVPTTKTPSNSQGVYAEKELQIIRMCCLKAAAALVSGGTTEQLIKTTNTLYEYITKLR